jgi:hypothetical protein
MEFMDSRQYECSFCVFHFFYYVIFYLFIFLFYFILFIYFFLPSKFTATYVSAFTIMINECKIERIEVAPSTIIIDFEEGIRAAVYGVWPSCAIKGCRFHLGQCWHRKIQQLGLATQYKSASARGDYF